MRTEPLIGDPDRAGALPPMHWFIYYQVQIEQLAGALVAARGVQQRLRDRHPALDTRLMRRPGDQDGRVTLMEIYTLNAAAASTDIEERTLADIEAEAALALGPWLSGPRHVETFVPCA